MNKNKANNNNNTSNNNSNYNSNKNKVLHWKNLKLTEYCNRGSYIDTTTCG
jgi:hypothetical protein